MYRTTRTRILATLGTGLLLAGCSTPAGTDDTSPQDSARDSQVLPVADDPIDNPSTAPGLAITSVLVENNVDPSTGKDAPDHLEIALANTTAAPLTGVEVFYTVEDTTTGDTESYYTDLGPDFAIPAGGERVVHFDDEDGEDHYPVNRFGLYGTSTNRLDVSVKVSAEGVAPQTETVTKDAGGEENPDE